MIQIILVLMLFIVLNTAFKLSFWKWWQAGIFSLLAAVFTAAMYPLAILQSKTQLADYLQNTVALQNMAILVTLETLLCLAFCMTHLDGLFSSPPLRSDSKKNNEVGDEGKNEIEKNVKKEVGCKVEKELGDKVEYEIGNELKSEVENKVGIEVDYEVENEVINEVGKEVGNEVMNEVKKSVKKEVSCKVGKELEDKVEYEIGNEMKSEGENKVGIEVGCEVGNEVISEVGKEVGNEVMNEVGDEKRGKVRNERKWWAKLLWWYPGLLIFPVLFYCLTELIFTFAGVQFTVTAYCLAAAVLILLPLLAQLMKYLVPEPELRLEFHFLISLFICVLGLLSTVNGRTVYAAVSNPVSISTLSIALGIFAILLIVGYIWNLLKFPYLQRKRKHKGKEL